MVVLNEVIVQVVRLFAMVQLLAPSILLDRLDRRDLLSIQCRFCRRTPQPRAGSYLAFYTSSFVLFAEHSISFSSAFGAFKYTLDMGLRQVQYVYRKQYSR